MLFSCLLSSFLIQQIFAATAQGTATSLEALFNETEPSTVRIVNTIPTNLFNPQVQNLTELGSGFSFDDKGHIVTAYHLLSGATTVDVINSDGERYRATVLGADPFSDVAVLQVVGKIDDISAISVFTSSQSNIAITKNVTFRPVSMGNSSTLSEGEQIVAIGYIFGSSGPSITGGLVSKTDYLLPFPAGGFSIPNIIQSDVTVNPGNSGGPLLDLTGMVMGMIYGRLNAEGVPLGQFPGMTAAIPSNIVNKVASSIVEDGFYLHPGIGIMGETLSSDLIQRMINSTHIPSGLQGVFVSKIQRGGTADLAGIEGSVTNEYDEIVGGDIITAIDGVTIKTFEELLAYVQESKSVGDGISFSIYRNGQVLKLAGIVQPFLPSVAR